jgi:DNA-binding transcriptional regulator YdaS (Cro superfamily)
MRKDLKFSADDPRVIACKQAVKMMGGYTKVARQFGLSPQAVYNWEVVPSKWCSAVASLTGITIFELRPDLFGFEKQRRTRGKINVSADPSSPTETLMDRRAAAGGEGAVGEGRIGGRGGPQDGVEPQSGLGADIPRPRTSIAQLFTEAKKQSTTAAKIAETHFPDIGRCGYGGQSW